jgi:hypothetical protein
LRKFNHHWKEACEVSSLKPESALTEKSSELGENIYA